MSNQEFSKKRYQASVGLGRRYGVRANTVWSWSHEPTFPMPAVLRGTHKYYDVKAVDVWVALYKPKYTTGKPNKSVVVVPAPPKAIPKPDNKVMEVITFLLKDDTEKQHLVLDLLLDR